MQLVNEAAAANTAAAVAFGAAGAGWLSSANEILQAVAFLVSITTGVLAAAWYIRLHIEKTKGKK